VVDGIHRVCVCVCVCVCVRDMVDGITYFIMKQIR
jgi:hypothetical protein